MLGGKLRKGRNKAPHASRVVFNNSFFPTFYFRKFPLYTKANRNSVMALMYS